MVRSVLSVLAGFAVWTVLWLASNAGVVAALPAFFREDGLTDSVGILVLFLVLSVVFSVVAGFLAARLARRQAMPHALTLGIILLAVGIFVQVQYWDVMPVWYHIIFLALLVPATLLGGRTQLDGEEK